MINIREQKIDGFTIEEILAYDMEYEALQQFFDYQFRNTLIFVRDDELDKDGEKRHYSYCLKNWETIQLPIETVEANIDAYEPKSELMELKKMPSDYSFCALYAIGHKLPEKCIKKIMKLKTKKAQFMTLYKTIKNLYPQEHGNYRVYVNGKAYDADWYGEGNKQMMLLDTGELMDVYFEYIVEQDIECRPWFL